MNHFLQLIQHYLVNQFHIICYFDAFLWRKELWNWFCILTKKAAHSFKKSSLENKRTVISFKYRISIKNWNWKPKNTVIVLDFLLNKNNTKKLSNFLTKNFLKKKYSFEKSEFYSLFPETVNDAQTLRQQSWWRLLKTLAYVTAVGYQGAAGSIPAVDQDFHFL